MGQNIKGAMLAAAGGMLVILAMTGIFSWMILKQILDLAHIDLMAAAVLITGSGTAAYSCGRGEGRIKRILGAELGIVISLAVLNLALFDGEISGLLPGVFLISGTAGAVMLTRLGKHSGQNRNIGRRKHRIGKLNKKYRR